MTRELYNAMQCEPGTPEESVADARWRSQCKAYNKHLQSILADLPQSMREFCGTTLHDGIINAVTRTVNNSVILEIDGSHCCWGPIGQFELRFHGVREVEGLQDTLNDWWLYEEVDLHPDAGFEYRVLLTRSQLRIVADDVKFTIVSRATTGM
jgi:hypothetical protein